MDSDGSSQLQNDYPTIMRILHDLAQKSNHLWAKHSAVVVRGGNIIAKASNKDYKHAECKALDALWPSERRGSTVWSVRWRRSGGWAMAKPCYDCEKYLKQNGVKKVIYSDDFGNLNTMRL